jgi:hemoglobin-like flavoprotein
MTEKAISLIKGSWRTIRQIEPTVLGDLFFEQLLIKNPSLQPLFKYSVERQSNLLFDFLNQIISRLDDANINDKAAELAQFYAAYGILPKHYYLISDALLWTLQKAIGKDWNAEMEAAWKKGSEEVVTMMARELSKI